MSSLGKRKGPGQGSVTRLGPARFWVRVRLSDGRRPSLGVYATEEEAEEVRIAALRQLACDGAVPMGGITLRAFGERWLAERAIDGIRGIRTERSRWAVHIDTAAFADDPVQTITAPLVRKWARMLQSKDASCRGQARRRISRKTVRSVVGLLRGAFDAAIEQGLAYENPAAGIKVRSEALTNEPWTYLTPEEQDAFLRCVGVPEHFRLIVAFAIGTGLRLGEQMNLELRDLHVDGPNPDVVVRFGSKGKGPKNGKIRRVPLFGLALDAARRWLVILPTYAPRNPEKLVFPGPRGVRRAPGKHLHRSVRVRLADGSVKVRKRNAFHEALRTAGIIPERRHDGRSVRWHDLRHTCASSLIAGWWGPAWRMEEAKELLGHSSIMVTQRYAHLAESVVRQRARETTGRGLGAGVASAA